MRRWPPCASTISLQSGRPRPEPPGLVDQNGRRARVIVSSLIPSPRSLTERRLPPARRSTSTTICSDALPASAAFFTRLMTSCSIWARSTLPACEGVVQLVVQHADGALPHLHLLPPQLGREAVRDPQQVRAAVEVERAACEVVRLVAGGEERVAVGGEGLAQRRRGAEDVVGEEA